MTLQDHVIKGSCGFIEQPFKITHHPAKFNYDAHSCSKDIRIFICLK